MKANLVSQLAARPGLTGVQVTNGPPLPATQREFIWVGDATGAQSWGSFGSAGVRHEAYGVDVAISVTREGEDIAAADARCFTLLAEVEGQLRTDPTVNGAVMAAKVGQFRLGEFVGRDGTRRVSELTVTVDVDTYI